MKISRLTNKFLIKKRNIGGKVYNKQRNLCVNLIIRKKYNFFSNSGTRDITYNKTIWKAAEHLLKDNVQTKSKITFFEKQVVSGEGQG